MKRYSNIKLGIVLIGLLTTGCKKENIQPVDQTDSQHFTTSGGSPSKAQKKGPGKTDNSKSNKTNQSKVADPARTKYDYGQDSQGRHYKNKYTHNSKGVRIKSYNYVVNKDGKTYTYTVTDHQGGEKPQIYTEYVSVALDAIKKSGKPLKDVDMMYDTEKLTGIMEYEANAEADREREYALQKQNNHGSNSKGIVGPQDGDAATSRGSGTTSPQNGDSDAPPSYGSVMKWRSGPQDAD